MERFGDFQLLQKISQDGPMVRYMANHPRQEKPLLLTLYQGFAPKEQRALRQKFERLMGLYHPHLEPHIGHGIVGEVPYRVTTYVDGISLEEFLISIGKRRVTLPMDNLFSIARALAKGLHAMHSYHNNDSDFQLTHGDIQAKNVHIAPNGRVLLSGVGRWENVGSSDPMEKVWDGAGLAALIYQMLRATKLTEHGLNTSADFDELLRIALGIGASEEFMSAKAFGTRLREIAIRQHVYTTLDRFRELANRTWRIVEAERQAATEAALTQREKEESHKDKDVFQKEDINSAEESSVKTEEIFKDITEELKGETSSSVEISLGQFSNEEPSDKSERIFHSVSQETAIEPLADGASPKNTTQSDSRGGLTNTDLEPTKKERLSFFQHLKNKGIFPDALLQMYMDSYDEEDEILEALWGNSNIAQQKLVTEMGDWLQVDTFDGLSVTDVIPEKSLLAYLPSAFFLEHICLPIQKVGEKLQCLVSNPFKRRREETLKALFQVEDIVYQLSTPRLVVEHAMRILQEYGRGKLFSPWSSVEISLVIFDANGTFPRDLAQKIAAKGWLLEWAKKPQNVLQMAMMNAPSAILCMTQKDELDAAQLLVELQTQPGLGPTSYFVLGHEDSDETIEKTLDLGVEDYFSMPVSPESVIAKMRRAFNRNLNYDSTPPTDVTAIPGPPPIPSTGVMEDMILAACIGEAHEHVEPDGLKGSLGSIGIADLIQNLIVRKKTARIDLSGEICGYIDLDEGIICGSVSDEKEGVQALRKLFDCSNEIFSIIFNPGVQTKNIKATNAELLLFTHHQNHKK